MSTNRKARAWVHVRADALKANYARVGEAAGSAVGVLPMVKADAYGLGMREVVEHLGPLRPWGFGVATVSEGVALRGLGVEGRVVVCSPIPPDDVGRAVECGLQLSVSSLSALRHLERAASAASRVAEFHIDVDTGMGRSGFDWRRADEWLPVVVASGDATRWVGCYTHLHSADEGGESIGEQHTRLEGVLETLRALATGADPPAVHVFNSAGVFRTAEHTTAVVRPGIFLYGGEVGAGQPRPRPVVSVHARVAHTRDVPPGTTLGYGATYTSSGPERWATLAIGYGDGLPRALGNRGSAIIRGVRVPIIGRISMDVTVVDISGVSEVREGDVATLLGEDGGERISLDEVATEAGTISYEVLTGLTARLPRIWTDGEG